MNIFKGGIIRLIRNVIDLANQVRRATEDGDVQDRMDRIIMMLDQDPVAVRFS